MKCWIKTSLFVFVVIIIIAAAYMAVTDIRKNMPKKTEKFQQEKLSICLFKAEWCGHCKAYQKSKTFDDVYSSIKQQDMFNGVVFATYDFDENQKLAEKYNINAFPSIVAVNSKGELIDTFNGDRYDKSELIKFVTDNLKVVS